MAKIQFTGLRNIGTLFGILATKSVPTELNIEEGVAVVYVANEAIGEDLGSTYTFFSQLPILAAATDGTMVILPWDSSPAIPESYRPNSYLLTASMSMSGAVGDFTQGSLSLLYGPVQFTPELLAQDTVAGSAMLMSWASVVAGTGPAFPSQAAERLEPRQFPWKLPSDGLRAAGFGSSLSVNVDKAAGASTLFMDFYAQFWAGPPGVQCPWL